MIPAKQNSNDTLNVGLVREDQNSDPKPCLRFWQVPDFFKCPLVGMCLTLKEQQLLLKKTDFPVKKASPFELHEVLVASSESENRLSKKADALLNRKFGKEAAQLLKLAPADFLSHFKKASLTDSHAAALWAAAIHPGLPDEIKREIFGEIHMGMHWSGEQRVLMNRKLNQQQDTLAELRRRIKDLSRQKRALLKETAGLKLQNSDLKAALAAAQKDQNRLPQNPAGPAPPLAEETLEQENKPLKQELDEAHARLKNQQDRISLLLGKNRELESQLGLQGDLNKRFTQEARTILAEMTSLNNCDATCPSFDLCRKRVLIVGGISRIKSLYRELIENSGGIFEYHDGYMKKGARKLEGRLKRADVVLCPVNCNSHAACSVVKNLAKKHNKTVHMLANSSLKAVSQALWGPVANRTVN